MLPYLYLLQQGRIVGYLHACDPGYLFVIEYLNIRLRHRHPDVVFRLLEVGHGRIELQPAALYAVVDLEALEYRQVCAETERSGTRVGVCVGVVGGKASSERDVLRGAEGEPRKPARLRRVEIYLLLLHADSALAHAYVMLERIVCAVLEAPRPLGLCRRADTETCGESGCEHIPFHGYSLIIWGPLTLSPSSRPERTSILIPSLIPVVMLLRSNTWGAVIRYT